jgi:gamma-glutamyltranspeptidase
LRSSGFHAARAPATLDRAIVGPIQPTPETPLEAHGTSYAVATPHSEATQVAVSTFSEGGNAVDAAIAAAAALAVAYPHMCSPGGDLIGLLATPDGEVRAINGSGAAPRAIASAAEGWSRMPFDGPHTVTVPGAVAAWQTMHELAGSMPWRSLVDPAVRLAADGVPVAGSLAGAIVDNSARIAADRGLREVLMPDGFPLPEGAPLRQPALARSLARIADSGAAALYGGEVGEELVSCLRALDSTVDVEDLRAHRTEVCEPIALRTADSEVLTAPPNSQGLALLQVLASLEELGSGECLGADAGLLGGLFRLAAAERDRHLGDPRFGRVPVAELLSRAHAAELARRARNGGAVGAEGFSGSSAGDTIALVTADAGGHAAVVVQSVFAPFGAAILDPASGIVCHNRGAFFSLDPGSPNVLEGGKRPAHTLMPVMLRQDGRVVGLHGTMGGPAQPQIHAQVLLRVRAGLGPAAAVAAPRFVVAEPAGGAGRDAYAETDLEPATAEALRAAGFAVHDLPPRSELVGHAQAIRRSGEGLVAGADPRADGSASAA